MDKLFVSHTPSKTPSHKKEVSICLLFLGKISIHVTKQLNNIFRSCSPDVKLKVVFKAPHRLRNSFSFKDVLPNYLNSKVIYKYSCGTCNSTYIGETIRHFIVRTYEHLGISIITDNAYTYNGKTATAIRKHSHECEHVSSMNNFKIVGSAKNSFHLKIKESLLIMKLNPNLNIAKESMPLCLFDD